jgi:hypothetical protein
LDKGCAWFSGATVTGAPEAGAGVATEGTEGDQGALCSIAWGWNSCENQVNMTII